jgi:hypothetical protein
MHKIALFKTFAAIFFHYVHFWQYLLGEKVKEKSRKIAISRKTILRIVSTDWTRLIGSIFRVATRYQGIILHVRILKN